MKTGSIRNSTLCGHIAHCVCVWHSSRLLCPVLLAGTLLIVMRSTRGFSLQQSVAFTGVGVQRSWVGHSISRSRLSIKVPSGTSRCRVLCGQPSNLPRTLASVLCCCARNSSTL